MTQHSMFMLRVSSSGIPLCSRTNAQMTRSHRSTSRFFHLCVAAGSGKGHGAALAGGLRIATGAIWQRQRRAKVRWHRTGNRDEREEEVGTLPLGLPKIFAPEFSRLGGPFHREIEMGPRLLPAATRTRSRSSRRRASVGVQMDSHRIPLLARQGCL
jgi:hypothetical protein